MLRKIRKNDSPAAPVAGFEGSQWIDQDTVVSRITKAMRLGRLKPGAKLSETVLADIFDTSRAHIRQVLSHLATKGLVRLYPNRGAFVAKLSNAEARQVFAARRVIEASTVAALSKSRSPHASGLLEAHVVREHEAVEAGNVMEMLIIAGDFHVLIASLAENDVLKGYVEDLVLRTALIISDYQKSGFVHCSCETHHQLAEYITSGDEKRAVALMLQHIDELEEPLLTRPLAATADLRAIFAEI